MKIKTLSIIIALIISICFSSCKQTIPKNIQNGLLGLWETTTPDGVFYESWENFENILKGKGYFLINADTMVFEKIEIGYRNDTLFYNAIVTDQNGDAAIFFYLTENLENSFTFSNPSHDFPQVIKYEIITPDSVNAIISGNINGEIHSEIYSFKRKR